MNLMSNLQKSWASCLPGYLCWNCPWSFSVGACAGVGSVPFYRSFVLVFFKPCRSCCVCAPRSRCHIPLLSHLSFFATVIPPVLPSEAPWGSGGLRDSFPRFSVTSPALRNALLGQVPQPSGVDVPSAVGGSCPLFLALLLSHPK